MSAEPTISNQVGGNPTLAAMLDPEHVRARANAASRKRAIQDIAGLLCTQEIPEDVLFEGLMDRERLGSTGLGEGVAIPHCRLPIEHMRVAFVSLAAPIDYEAIDSLPVDLLFVLVVPVDEPSAHLEALAALSEIFAEASHCAALRACADDVALYNLMHSLLSGQATQPPA